MMDIGSGLLKKLTERLMHDVYHPFTLCVWLGDDERILNVYQFDTLFCEPVWSSTDGAAECCLISNHHDGHMRPFEEDMRNWRSLSALVRDAKCRLFIYSEDEGLYEIKEM